MALLHQSMALHDVQPLASVPRWTPRSWEARLLAGSVRGVPITLLHGADTASRDELLRQGVLPLLGRRNEDQAERGRRNGVLPFPERRGPRPPGLASPARQCSSAEWVLVIDSWQADPHLPSLAEHIGSDAKDKGRLLLVLQGFEPMLAVASRLTLPDPFWRELSDALADPATDIHLLLLADDASSPALGWLARLLPGLGEHALQLGTGPSVAVPPHLVAVPGLDAAATGPAPTAQATVSDLDWRLSVDAVLQQVAAQARAGDQAPAEQRIEVVPVPAPAQAQAQAQAQAPESEPAFELHPVASMPRSRPLWPLAAVALATSVIMGGWLQFSDQRPPVSEPVSEPVKAPVNVPVQVAAPRPTSAPPRSDPGQALLQALSPLAVTDLRIGPDRVSQQLAGSGRPQLALVRYDALQTLPTSRAFDRLRLVAPLFVEPVQVWVRADSPLRGLHELRTASVDTGFAAGDDASGIAAALFGNDVGAMRQRRLADEQALGALLGGEVDALLRTRASPLTARAEASAAGGALRRLLLDRGDPSSARALRDYLPVAGGLGVMNFLVVAGGDEPGRERLAAQALQALCSALPALRAGDAASWSGVRPGQALPAGRPYAKATNAVAASCGVTPIPPSIPARSSKGEPP